MNRKNELLLTKNGQRISPNYYTISHMLSDGQKIHKNWASNQ